MKNQGNRQWRKKEKQSQIFFFSAGDSEAVEAEDADLSRGGEGGSRKPVLSGGWLYTKRPAAFFQAIRSSISS